jgi:hypothetical protein
MIVLIQIAITSITFVQAQTTPSITTDKADYAPTETVLISGSGFEANTNYYIPVIRPDGTIVLGDGTFTPGYDSINSDTDGAFLYEYILDGVFGLYEVRVYDSVWDGDLDQEPIASTTFTDAAKVTLDQAYNDQDPTDGTPDVHYSWGGGGINHENSILTEGNFPPPYPPYIPGHVNYRMIIEALPADTYTIIIEYEFSKGGIPAFDFLTTSYDIDAYELKIDLPGSPADKAQFSAIIDAGVSDHEPFPDDPFAVGATLNGGLVSARQAAHATAFSGESLIGELRIYGGATIVDIVQNAHTGPLTGDSKSSVNVTITKTSLESEAIILTWGGHIAIGQPYPIGYGPGYGAASISGGPFHMYINNIYDDEDNAVVNSGKNVNVQLGAVVFSSTTTTLLSQSTITLGQSVTDTATVTGFGPTPTGTVDFQVSTDMISWTTFDSNVPLVSGSATSASYEPLTAGTYYFRAVYSGDSNYNGATSGDDEEPLVVEPVYFVKTFTDSGSLTPGQEPPISPNGLETFVSQKKTGPTIWWEVTYTVTNEGPDGYFIVWDKWGGNRLVLGGTPTAFNDPTLTLTNHPPFSINPRAKNGASYRKYVEDGNLIFSSINADGLGTDDGTAYVTLHTGDKQQGTNPGKGKGTDKDGTSYDLDIRWEIGFLAHGETASFTIIVAPGMNPGSQLEFTSYGEFIINTGPVIRVYEDPDFNDFNYSVPDTNQLTVFVGEAYEPDWLT